MPVVLREGPYKAQFFPDGKYIKVGFPEEENGEPPK